MNASESSSRGSVAQRPGRTATPAPASGSLSRGAWRAASTARSTQKRHAAADASSSGSRLDDQVRRRWRRYGSRVIEARGLTKDYGDKRAVDGLSFTVQPGVVTGFLGPNGSGKSTTMRLILGLDRPTAGDVTVNGKHYRDLAAPLHEVGALLEARSVHTGRSAYYHLLSLAQTHGIPKRRVGELIDLVGLHDVARKRAGQFSLGMGQRLGIATALLGDPQTVMLDEPGKGLDPEGIHWIRNLLKSLAAEGRTVFVSSHVMSEMALTAEHLIVIGRGKLIADTSVTEFIERASTGRVKVRSPQAARLGELLAGPEVTV